MPKSFRKNNKNNHDGDSSSSSTNKHCFGLNRLRRAFTAHHKPMTQPRQNDEEVVIGLHRDYTLASLEGRVEREHNSPTWDALRQWLREGRTETVTPGERQNTTTTVTTTNNGGMTLNRSNAVRKPAPLRDLNHPVPTTCPSTPRTPRTPQCDKPLPSKLPPQLPIRRRPVPQSSDYYDRPLPPTPLRPEFATGNNRPLPPVPLKPVIPPSSSSTSDDNSSPPHCSRPLSPLPPPPQPWLSVLPSPSTSDDEPSLSNCSSCPLTPPPPPPHPQQPPPRPSVTDHRRRPAPPPQPLVRSSVSERRPRRLPPMPPSAPRPVGPRPPGWI